MKVQQILVLAFFVLVLPFALTISSVAHPGRTDSRGGHNSPSGYHYHHGYPAHSHSGGVCPYDYDDKTNHDGGNSNDNNNKQNSYTESTTTTNSNKQSSYKTPTANEIHISGADVLSSIVVLIVIGINIYLLVCAIRERPHE